MKHGKPFQCSYTGLDVLTEELKSEDVDSLSDIEGFLVQSSI